MDYWIIAGIVALVFLLVLGTTVYSARRFQTDAEESIARVTEPEVPALVEECVSVFELQLGLSLSMEDMEHSAETLDSALSHRRGVKVIEAFRTPDHPSRYVLPLGAYLGELIRRHNNGKWIPRDGGGLAMEVDIRGTLATIHPFDKVRKQSLTGAPGDLTFLVRLATGNLHNPFATEETPAEQIGY